jgi:predicted nucleotidyltransferase
MAGSPYQASLPAHREGAPLLSRPNALCTSLIATAGEVVAQLPDRDLRAAVLFGSVAWGDADEASDLDLMLLLDQPAGYREVTRLRVADLLGRPLPDGPRFIDLDRRSAQTFEEGEGRWFQRIVNSIILADTDGWYEGIRVQTTDEYATPACRRARWQDYAERANTERAALSRAREMGDGPLAALYGRLAVETAAAGLVDLHDDRVSLTHFIENVERALRARGKEALLPLVLQTFALEAVAAEDAERSLAAYRRFAGVLEAWMAEPDVVGRLSAEDAAWAAFTYGAETYEEIDYKVAGFRKAGRSAALQFYLDGLLTTLIRMNLGKVLRLRERGSAGIPAMPEFQGLLRVHPALSDAWLAALRLDGSARRLEVAEALAGELLDLGQQVVTGADGMAPT